MRISDWSSDVCSSDLKGSQFDGAGNNVNWWTKEDRARFEARADKLVAQFDGYAPLADHPDKHANGKLTLGANIGDLGALRFAYAPLKAAHGNKPDPQTNRLTLQQQARRRKESQSRR